MGENSNRFEFMPKTDETFIAPNDKFNSFTNFCNKSELNIIKDNERPGIESEDNKQKCKTSEQQSSKGKVEFSMQSKDKFVDFIVKQFKSDGIVCTLDENERQIYYCYYCHQYVNDYDLIQTHIDTAKHLNNILNGISFKRGLDKEFVIETISEKTPKDLNKRIHKELGKIPFHMKHYYYRNSIRLMDVLPPNAYFCKSCNQSIPNLKAVETHLLSETHESSQQKLTLMQLIDKSDDLALKIGLEFLTEDKIPDSSSVVYECELCNCLDCNSEKMFSHIKSTEHRINLLKKYDYKTDDLLDDEIESLIKEVSEKHSSGSINTSQRNKSKTSAEVTPKSNSSSNSPIETLSQIETKVSPKPLKSSLEIISNNSKDFIHEDILLANFESHKIIKTFESDGREIYYCCYCDQYYNTFASLEQHIDEPTHQKLQTNGNNCSKGLNDKLSMKSVSESMDSLSPNKSSEINHLNDIPVVIKHHYFKRGIKYTGAQEYYCRLCQISIPSFELIEEHFKHESHSQIEEKPTKFNDLLFQTNQPIIGLKYIKEYIKEKSKHILYECILCNYSNDFCQMFVHLNCFSHQFKVLSKLSPNNRVFKIVKEKEVSYKSSGILKDEILKIEQQIGCGFVTKIYDSPQQQQKSPQRDSEQRVSPSTVSNCDETKDLLPKRQSNRKIEKPFEKQKNDFESTEEKSIELLDQRKPIPLSEDMLLSSLQTLFGVQLQDENEASILVSIVESLKDSLIKFYSNSISPEMRPILGKRINENKDSYDVCEMDET